MELNEIRAIEIIKDNVAIRIDVRGNKKLSDVPQVIIKALSEDAQTAREVLEFIDVLLKLREKYKRIRLIDKVNI